MALHHLIDASVSCRGTTTAVVEGNGSGDMDYAKLAQLSDLLRNRLATMDIGRGDRVGLYLRKSADCIASIFGILKAGAAYVPVDPTAPVARNAYIHCDCAAKVVIIERRFLENYRKEREKFLSSPPQMIVLESVGGGAYLKAALETMDSLTPAQAAHTAISDLDDLAYILYTSGSTGKPKGVMLTHRNAISFVGWCSTVFCPRSDDVFSSHAPLHFDLSIFDIYVSLKHGARLVLIPEEMAKEPTALSKLIADFGITVWYSAPSILGILAQFGKITEYDYSSLRFVLFAGEVFPIVHLRSLKLQVRGPRYFNLYGPTETNVCTYFEIPQEIAVDRADPFPIGRTCENLESKVISLENTEVPAGTEGELCIAGPNVMEGYWNLSEQTVAGFLPEDGSKKRWYKTGDLVIESPSGDYRYLGRRDRMVKKRGYRIELGEIEVCLYLHPMIREAAVIALPDNLNGIRIKAHLAARGSERPSVVALKTFCSQNLPLYMVPDTFCFRDEIPKTSTGKTDFQRLKKEG